MLSMPIWHCMLLYDWLNCMLCMRVCVSLSYVNQPERDFIAGCTPWIGMLGEGGSVYFVTWPIMAHLECFLMCWFLLWCVCVCYIVEVLSFWLLHLLFSFILKFHLLLLLCFPLSLPDFSSFLPSLSLSLCLLLLLSPYCPLHFLLVQESLLLLRSWMLWCFQAWWSLLWKPPHLVDQ